MVKHLVSSCWSGLNQRVLMHPLGYIYNPPKPSFDKEGFRGRQSNRPNKQQKISAT